MEEFIRQVNEKVATAHDDIIQFFREIVAIPSLNSDIEEVGKRVGEEMSKLGFDDVYVDKYGSIVGRIGNGEKIILFDSHLDTVGIGDPDQWEWDPFIGKVENGMLYARGALDEKNSTPGCLLRHEPNDGSNRLGLHRPQHIGWLLGSCPLPLGPFRQVQSALLVTGNSRSCSTGQD